METKSAWKQQRCDQAHASQWRRRVRQPVPFILEEVHARMVNRAQIIRPVEGDVVVHGWLHPTLMPAVQALFPERLVWAAQPVAHHALIQDQESPQAQQSLKALFKRVFSKEPVPAVNPWRPLACQANGIMEHPSSSVGMVWSPLWLHGVQSPAEWLEEWFRVLKLQGGVFFSALGPDTARLMNEVAAELGVAFPDFMDMHDLGDLMVQVGFSDPVMEMERITLTYEEAATLLSEWRALVGNPLSQRPKGLKGPQFRDAIVRALQAKRDPGNGRIALPLEIVYGHAWKVRPKSKPGETLVPLSSLKRPTAS